MVSSLGHPHVLGFEHFLVVFLPVVHFLEILIIHAFCLLHVRAYHLELHTLKHFRVPVESIAREDIHVGVLDLKSTIHGLLDVLALCGVQVLKHALVHKVKVGLVSN